MDTLVQTSLSTQILIADDDATQRKLLGLVLKQAGYQLLEAENGQQALDLYQAHRPDMVVLDGLMPIMDGFDCCAALQKLPGSEVVPILMITGLDAEAGIERAFAVGATDFITKPLQMTALRQRIQRLLRAAQAEKALRQSEKQYRSLVVNLEEIIFQTNGLGEFTFLNPAWQGVTGFDINKSLGRNFTDYIHPIDIPHHSTQFHKILQGKTKKSHYHMRCRMSSEHLSSDRYGWLDVCASPLKNDMGQIVGISGHLNDSTERRQREQHQRIAYCVARILSGGEMANMLHKVLQAICGNLHWDLAELWQLEHQTQRLVCTEMWHLRSQDFAPYRKASDRLRFAPGEDLPGQVWSSQESIWMADLSQAPNFVRATVATRVGLKTGFGFPVLSDQGCVGVMMFFSSEHRPVNPELIKLMMSLGRQIGQFMKRKAAELEVRRQTQILQEEIARASAYVQSLLPTPLTDSVQVKGLFLPSAQLGGDAFDYYWLDQDHLVLYLLDVAGHGVKSALVSVSVLNILRSQSLVNADFYHPASVLSELNHTFQMNEAGDDYFTIWYGVYNRKTQTLTYGSGGHPPAILVLPCGEVCQLTELATQGLAIGMFEDWPYQEQQQVVPTGSSLFIFSDGAYEIDLGDGKYWDWAQFTQLLWQYKCRSQQSLDYILKQVQEVNQSPSLEDDFSLLESIF
jgi:sigma-B regulation protein RsbU (phosphoserine phosphatase)